ncbi:uncharacterized protein LOC126909001 [Daktulosphaira vitifoliae]|uniref:uncharacterized protein LOC126909001 n=2 Tax=Daktulosphaira vitifoliae TaxID=58002 RepID=UPI0021AAE2E9|nr:uncharacterized protein LOC126909001 [Daktulosphaira vitifoliae]
MDDLCLDVTESYVDQCKIISQQVQSFLPYSSTALGKNDEIRFEIRNMDSYTLPSASYLYLEGEVKKPDGMKSSPRFINNGLAYLFSEIRYEINGTQIQKVRNPGITSTLKGYCSYSPADINELHTAAWDITTEDNKDFFDCTYFSGIIPLSHILGFAEDYKKILLNCTQSLICTRSSSDINVIKLFNVNESSEKLKCSTGTSDDNEVVKLLDTSTTVKEKLSTVSIKLTKVVWNMPIVKVTEKEQLKLLRVLDSKKPIHCAHRNWELCEYPFVPQNKSFSWTVKTCNNFQKPRYVIVGFQTDRKNSESKSMSEFDHCNLTNLKVHLNSEVYPYIDLRCNFDCKLFSILFSYYVNFQKSYYDRPWCSPLVNKKQFLNLIPIAVIDMSKQNDTITVSSFDLRIEIEASAAFPGNTTAYALVISDNVFTYTPFDGTVRIF